MTPTDPTPRPVDPASPRPLGPASPQSVGPASPQSVGPATPAPGGPTPAARPAVVLIGPPGAGKSTVGSLLADRLGLPLLDTDALLAERHGTTVGDLLIDAGEEEFRRLEAEVAADAFGRPGVLALGSGAVPAVADAVARYREEGGTVVFLDVSLSAAVPRVGLNAPRAVVVGSPRAMFATMARARRPAYVEAATTTVDTSELSPDAVAAAVIDVLAQP